MIADVNTFTTKVSLRRPREARVTNMYRPGIPMNWRVISSKLANTAFMAAIMSPVFLYFLPK